jgi:Zn ribbon nucleic-acid-binding protein
MWRFHNVLSVEIVGCGMEEREKLPGVYTNYRNLNLKRMERSI